MQEIDVVYPVGIGSIWKDNEMRYSLRSLEKNLIGLRNVFIVGHLPQFIQRVIHIPAADIYRENKDANLIMKILMACDHPSLSENFVRLSDDQLVLKPICEECFENWWYEDLKDRHFGRLNNWGKRLKNTYNLLKQQGLPTKNYDSHIPMIYNKKSFVDIMNRYPWNKDGSGEGFTINTLYFNNIYKGERVKEGIRFNVETPLDKATLQRGFEKNMFLGYDERGRNNELEEVIQEAFLQKSKYEID